MHVLGKVLTWFVVVLGGVAIILAAGLAGIRNSWIKKNKQADDQIATNVKALGEKRLELSRRRAEYDRLMLSWDRYFNGVTAAINDTGDVQLQIGRPDFDDKDQKSNPASPVVYAFRALPDGSSEYLGEFRATNLQQGISSWKPVWRLRPSDLARLKASAGNDWRIRTAIPVGQRDRFVDLEEAFVKADELFQAEDVDMKKQSTELVDFAKKHLAMREGEIMGFDQVPADLRPNTENLPPEYVHGILATIASSEAERNALLAETDRLRRELRETQLQFEHVRKRNLDLTHTLPQPESARPKVTQVAPATARAK